jgi:hypothetical protein
VLYICKSCTNIRTPSQSPRPIHNRLKPKDETATSNEDDSKQHIKLDITENIHPMGICGNRQQRGKDGVELLRHVGLLGVLGQAV